MGLHSATFEASTVADDCMGAIVSDGTVLPEILDIRIGFTSAPDDERYTFGVYEVSDIGAGSTDATKKKIGMTNPTACGAKHDFSTQPTKVGGLMMSMNPHRRATEIEKRPKGEGFKPTALAANRGIAIFCDTAPGAIDAVITVIWEE